MNARDHELFDAYCIAVVRGNSVDEKRLAAELERREKARHDKPRVRGGVDIRMVRSDVAERMTEMWKSQGRLDAKEYLRLREKLILEPVIEAEDTDKTTQESEESEEESAPPLQQPAAKQKTAQVKIINLVTPQQEQRHEQEPEK